jgi:hypothetical protein
MSTKRKAYRGIRKGANLSRRVLTKGAVFSGRVENKANRLILDRGEASSKNSKTVPFEKIYNESLPEITPIHPSLPMAGREAAATLLIPSLQNSSFFGGTATALIVAATVAQQQNIALRVVETLTHGNSSPKAIRAFLLSSNIDWDPDTEITLEDLSYRSYNRYGYLNIHPDDIFLASAWWDAYTLSQLPLKRKFIYLIQDFEPIFYNNSDRYALAESTYGFENFVALCNTKLMYDFMVNRNYVKVKNGAWFEPAVARKNKAAGKSQRKHKKLFLYGRPSVERNLFYNAISSIEKVFADNVLDPKEWEVEMAGQDDLPNIKLSTGKVINNLGKMNMDQYVELIYNTDLAVTPMMAPHPNYPTLEFAAAGAAVVTTRYDIKQDLTKYSSNIIMSDITPESMAAGIKTAAQLSDSQREANHKKNDIGSSWQKSLAEPVKKVLASV